MSKERPTKDRRLPDDYADRESPAAQAAKERYYDLGPGRTLERLCELYREEKKAGQLVPSTCLSTLKGWSSAHHWQDYCYSRQQREADLAEARAVDELKKRKQARIQSAQAAQTVGTAVLSETLKRLKEGELNGLPLVGRMVYPDKEKGEKFRPYRVDGLLDVLPRALKAIDVGQKLERTELGEDADERFEAVIEAIIAELTPEEQAQVRAFAFRLGKQQLEDGH